jgi:DNA-binding HxlR family transcriptional regulator
MERTDGREGYIPESKQDDSRCTPEEAAEALQLLEGKWKLFIVFRLFEEPALRFAELRRRIPGVTEKMLIQQLRDLESSGIVSRKVYLEVPPKVEYALTEAGRGLYPVLDELLKWWKSNVRQRTA